VTPVWFAVAASCGALGRQVVHQLAPNWQALLIVNLAGSFVLGMVVDADLSLHTTTVLGVAFCGSLTTFSGVALELRHQRARTAIGYAALMAASTCAAAALGMSLL
jgi:fluoride ion exporter CrcB/FEX